MNLLSIIFNLISVMKMRLNAYDVLSPALATEILAKYGSPAYVYNQEIIQKKCQILKEIAPDFQLSYAIKANSNKTIAEIIRSSGIEHVDCVSPGEILKAKMCGFKSENIIYTQNFISEEEIEFALKQKITLNIGSVNTLKHFAKRLNHQSIFIRINPGVGRGQNEHVITGGPHSKFGICLEDIEEVLQVSRSNNIHIIGLHQHLGSNFKSGDEEVVIETTRHIFELSKRFEEVQFINIGGGIGVSYRDGEKESDARYLYTQIRTIRDQLFQENHRKITVSIEPGRFLVADSSVLLTTITAIKRTSQKIFYGTDTGFNHLIRPALYGSFHEIVNLTNQNAIKEKVQICGNICECTDFLGKNIEIGGKIGDILAIADTGAYGYCMSSTYNERRRPPQILISGDLKNAICSLIRRRETYEDLFSKEIGLQEKE